MILEMTERLFSSLVPRRILRVRGNGSGTLTEPPIRAARTEAAQLDGVAHRPCRSRCGRGAGGWPGILWRRSPFRFNGLRLPRQLKSADGFSKRTTRLQTERSSVPGRGRATPTVAEIVHPCGISAGCCSPPGAGLVLQNHSGTGSRDSQNSPPVSHRENEPFFPKLAPLRCISSERGLQNLQNAPRLLDTAAPRWTASVYPRRGTTGFTTTFPARPDLRRVLQNSRSPTQTFPKVSRFDHLSPGKPAFLSQKYRNSSHGRPTGSATGARPSLKRWRHSRGDETTH